MEKQRSRVELFGYYDSIGFCLRRGKPGPYALFDREGALIAIPTWGPSRRTLHVYIYGKDCDLIIGQGALIEFRKQRM